MQVDLELISELGDSLSLEDDLMPLPFNQRVYIIETGLSLTSSFHTRNSNETLFLFEQILRLLKREQKNQPLK